MPSNDETFHAEHTRKIHEQTITDDCTGLYNARHLSFMLDTEVSRSERYGYEFSFLEVTLEGLRELEGSIGCLGLNRLLAEVGRTIKAACRLIDFAFHYGDGEFLVLLPETSKERASEFTRQLRESLVGRAWLTQEGHNVRLKVSAGVVSYPEDARTKAELLQSLDKTMYLVRNASEQRDSTSTAQGQGRPKSAIKALRLLVRGLLAIGRGLEIIWRSLDSAVRAVGEWVSDTLSWILSVFIIALLIIGLIWVLKWLWVHLPV